jgi:aminoglycoside phosphotransferase family enzyme/predicted kinase
MTDAAPEPGAPGLHRLLARVAGPGATFGETHVSVLAFTDDRVFKAKKAVRFDFVDLSTRERRLANCRNEVALNRRLAPDVYLGVVDLAGDDGTVVDHAVEMRRLPDDRRLSRILGTGETASCVDAIAGLLARFHANAAQSTEIDDAASAASVRDLWERGLAETAPFAGDVLDAAVADEVEERALRFVDGRRPLFDARVAAGRARDGHGDLLCDDIFCLADGPRVLDCLEFDPRLRAGDVLADVAFLAMDLEWSGRADLARRLLDGSHAASGDDWPAALEHFYVAYRAHVRAKVACLRHAQDGDAATAAGAQGHLDLALAHLRGAEVRLVLDGGRPGTGKSTIADALARRHGWVLVRSDEVRKELAGVTPTTRAPAGFGTGLYSDVRTRETYGELLARAHEALTHGASVVLDASWSDARERARAVDRAAHDRATLVALQCVAPRDVADDRIRRRLLTEHDPSDATPLIARAMAARFDPWPAAVAVDTAGTVDDAVARADDAISRAR